MFEPNLLQLIDSIHCATEHEKALLARELHDELGGLLVGAVMDIAWAEQHLTAPTADLKVKLTRARQTLSTAIDMKRHLIENLRPTLLDNVGLYAALRWHVQAICKSAGIACKVVVPDEEPQFLPQVPIALFRIVQDAFSSIVVAGRTSAATFEASFQAASLIMTISTVSTRPGSTEARPLAAIDYRIGALAGVIVRSPEPAGDGLITVTFPLAALLPPKE